MHRNGSSASDAAELWVGMHRPGREPALKSLSHEPSLAHKQAVFEPPWSKILWRIICSTQPIFDDAELDYLPATYFEADPPFPGRLQASGKRLLAKAITRRRLRAGLLIARG